MYSTCLQSIHPISFSNCFLVLPFLSQGTGFPCCLSQLPLHTGHKAGMPLNAFFSYEMAFLMWYQRIKQIKETLAPRRETLSMQGLNIYRKVVAILWPDLTKVTKICADSFIHCEIVKETKRVIKNTVKEEERFCKEKSCIQINSISLHPMNKKELLSIQTTCSYLPWKFSQV